MFSLKFVLLVVLPLAIHHVQGFGINHAEEEKVIQCLIHGEDTSFRNCKHMKIPEHKKEREKSDSCATFGRGSVIGLEDFGDTSLSDEFICDLMDFSNVQPTTRRSISKAIRHIGTCSHAFSSVFRKWKRFLLKRRFTSIPLKPSYQTIHGSTVTASFSSMESLSEYKPGELVAVDIILSRLESSDIEAFGSYRFKASIHHRYENGFLDEGLIVHQGLQSTCQSNRTRYFVGEMNAAGLSNVANWFTRNDETLTLVVDFIPLTQIVQDGNSNEYTERRFNVIDKISGLVLHLNKTKPMIFPDPVTIFRDDRRRKRHANEQHKGDCHKESYIMDWTNIKYVTRPMSYDIHECVGSCENIFTVDTLNATEHAISIKLEDDQGDPRRNSITPTVCCVPISYKRFYFLTRTSEGAIMGTHNDRMVVKDCGCR